MPSMKRRVVLASLGTMAFGGLAGCSFRQSESPPAGSLRFENNDDLPHSITVRVIGVGTEPGENPGTTRGNVIVRPSQRTLTASTTLSPGVRETYEGVFTESIWYAVRFTLDGREPENAGRTTFNPAPPGRERGRFLSGTVSESGAFSWVISSTDNAGSFELGGNRG